MDEYFAQAPELKAALWARMLGKRYYDSSYRFRLAEINTSFRGLCFKFGCYGSPHLNIGIIAGQAFIRLPNWTMRFFGGENNMERNSYGFSWRWFDPDGGDIHLAWKQGYKIIRMPWGWRDYRREYLGTDGLFYPDGAQADHYSRHINSRKPLPPMGPPEWTAVYPFHYMTDQGDAQHVNATVKRSRTRRTWRLFGLPVKRRIGHEIDVAFDDEVGNQRGSWKGGTVGCGYDMKPGEMPRGTLRRMQRERRFCR